MPYYFAATPSYFEYRVSFILDNSEIHKEKKRPYGTKQEQLEV